MPHSDPDLDALDDLLLSLSDDGMLLSEFDGFCAGLIVCPELIPPSEWLPLVVGPVDSFDSLEDMQQATEKVMAHYNRVAASLIPPATGFEAIYDTDGDETLWELWMSGFSSAFALRPDCLDAIAEDAAGLQAVSTFVQLHMVAEREEGLDPGTAAYLSETAPSLIPEMVVALNAATKSQGSAPPVFPLAEPDMAPMPALNPNRRVGRNDPCPCGSGRKYKRCCGAN